MATFGRIEDGVVLEVIIAVDQAEIDSKFHATIAAQFVEDTNNEIVEGWTYDGASFSAPAAFVPTVDQIKIEANRRIGSSGHDWMATREIGGDTVMPANIKAYATAIRLDCATLEVSLPADYTDDSHWAIYTP